VCSSPSGSNAVVFERYWTGVQCRREEKTSLREYGLDSLGTVELLSVL